MCIEPDVSVHSLLYLQLLENPLFSLCAKTLLIALTVALLLVAGRSTADASTNDTSPESPGILGYTNELPRETIRQKVERRRKVAERRANLPLLVHRGATTLAPENTLEAFAAAMDHGADGVEIDIYQTADGVLYLMHDDTLDRTTTGSGKGRDMTYYEILQFEIKGARNRNTRVPTLAAFLQLARERAILIHLDVKQSGIQEDIMRMIEQADIWDHIVECNEGNAEKLRHHPKVNLLQYKGWLPERRGEPDMHAITWFLGQDGNMIFCKDVEFAVRALGRPKPEKPTPLGNNLRASWTPEGVCEAMPD